MDRICVLMNLLLRHTYKSFQVVDMWYKSTDLETFTMSRKLIREEGLLCGEFDGILFFYYNIIFYKSFSY